MLGTAQADALGAEAAGAGSVLGGVGVGADVEAALLVGPRHDPVDRADQFVGLRGVGAEPALEVLDDRGGDDRDLAEVDRAGGAVDGDQVALLDDHSPGRGHAAALGVDVEGLRAANARLAHAAGDDGRVRGLAAARRQDALRGDHAVQVVGVGLAADQDDALAGAGPLDGGVGVEHRSADGRAGRGVHARGDALGLRVLVEAREHELSELGAGDALDGLVGADPALVDELDRDAERGGGGALADPGLEHPQLAALDRELDVAQVAVVLLQLRHDAGQLRVGRRVQVAQLLQLHRVADTRDDVLALGVLQVVAVDAGTAGRRIAGEGHAGAGVHAEVAEHHRADVHRGAEVAGDALLAAVELGAVAVPGLEHRADRQVHLLAGVLRERPAGLLLDDVLEPLHQGPEILGVQVQVVLRALGVLGTVQGVVEVLAAHAQHGLAEHLDEAAVGVPREAHGVGCLSVSLGRQAVDRLVVQADVEDGVHHARHRELRPGPHGDQERAVGLADALAHPLLQRGEVLGDLGAQLLRLLPVLQVGAARLGGDGEAGRDRQPQVRHLGEVGALAAEQVLEVSVALGEVVHELRHAESP